MFRSVLLEKILEKIIGKDLDREKFERIESLPTPFKRPARRFGIFDKGPQSPDQVYRDLYNHTNFNRYM